MGGPGQPKLGTGQAGKAKIRDGTQDKTGQSRKGCSKTGNGCSKTGKDVLKQEYDVLEQEIPFLERPFPVFCLLSGK